MNSKWDNLYFDKLNKRHGFHLKIAEADSLDNNAVEISEKKYEKL